MRPQFKQIGRVRAGFFHSRRAQNSRNARAHRLGRLLARQHPEWRLAEPSLLSLALDLALLVAAVFFLLFFALGVFP